MRLDFDKETCSWDCTVNEGETYRLMTFVDDTHVMLPAGGDKSVLVEVSKAGVMAYQEQVMPAMALR